MTGLAWSLAAVFAGLAALHVYWAFGGGRGKLAAVPESDGKPIFRPGVGSTLAVAVLLAVAATLILERAGAGPGVTPPLLSRVGAWGVAGVLALRAFGDLNFVGFFKRPRDTRFARLDTRYFSPLALALALGAGLVAWGL